MLESDNVECEIIDYLRDELGAPEDLTPSAPLFSSGTVDSFDLIRILSFLDERFGVEVTPLEVSLENFDSVRGMCALVLARSSQS